MGLNWIDVTILAIVLYFVYSGWERGLALIVADVSSLLISLWLAIRYHGVVGTFFGEKFGIPFSWTTLLGYLAVAVISQFFLDALFHTGIKKIPKKFTTSKINHALGSALSAVHALVIIVFFLLLILALPLRGSVKGDIKSSPVARTLVTVADRYGGRVKSSLEDAARKAVGFLTITPESKETIPLDLPDTKLTLAVHAEAERSMLELLNAERTSRGIPALRVDPDMTEVARGKSRDMFERRYFSHYDPEGKNAADRMEAAGVRFSVVGENLAFAPDVRSAHTGLMESVGHRQNILEPRFGRIGIGVIDGGTHGMMFTQLFAD